MGLKDALEKVKGHLKYQDIVYLKTRERFKFFTDLSRIRIVHRCSLLHENKPDTISSRSSFHIFQKCLAVGHSCIDTHRKSTLESATVVSLKRKVT